MTNRWDETWHRLREWTNGQAPSERLAAQILLHENYDTVDPSHPLGGKDGGKDAICHKDGKKWLMAVYFPRGQQDFNDIKSKFSNDLNGVKHHQLDAMCFVTNQELRLAERTELQNLAGDTSVELFHLERITAILDKPDMVGVRKQFLGIDFADEILSGAVASVKHEVVVIQKRLEALQSGGDTFCYCMFYHFDLDQNIARNFVIIREGEFPLYDVRVRIRDMDTNRDILERNFGEHNSPADFILLKWPLRESIYYRIFIHARNGSWHQDLILKRSITAQCWLAATRVHGFGPDPRLEHLDNEFISEFGLPSWR